MKSPQWTKEEIVTLKEMAAKRVPQNEIASKLNRTRVAVSGKLYSLGLNSKFKWTEEEVKRLKEYIANGDSMTTAASRLGRAPETVQRKCKKIGITTAWSEMLQEQKELKKEGVKRCLACKKVKPHSKEFFRRSNGYCLSCESETNAKHSRSSLEVVLSRRCRAAKTRARNKGVEFSLTPSSLLTLLEHQKGKCFYTGKEMTLGGAGNLTRAMPDAVSLDRICPDKGYVEGNIVLCCWAANYMKGDFSANDFKEWCKAVCDYN